MNPAGDRRLEAEERLEQRGLAGAVGAEDGGKTGPGNGQRNAGQHGPAIVTNGQAVKCDDGFAHIKKESSSPRPCSPFGGEREKVAEGRMRGSFHCFCAASTMEWTM